MTCSIEVSTLALPACRLGILTRSGHDRFPMLRCVAACSQRLSYASSCNCRAQAAKSIARARLRYSVSCEHARHRLTPTAAQHCAGHVSPDSDLCLYMTVQPRTHAPEQFVGPTITLAQQTVARVAALRCYDHTHRSNAAAVRELGCRGWSVQSVRRAPRRRRASHARASEHVRFRCAMNALSAADGSHLPG